MSDESKTSTLFDRITPAVLAAHEDVFFERFGVLQMCAPLVHIDICDAQFVTSMTVPYTFPGSYDHNFFHQLDLKAVSTEVHLMVKDPHDVGVEFIKAGAARIIVQWESFASGDELAQTIAAWREYPGVQVTVSILLPTDIQPLLTFVRTNPMLVSGIQVMSIDPIGAQGRPFDPRALQRIKDIKAQFPNLPVSVDGGMHAQTIPPVFHAGAERAVVGSAVSSAEITGLSFT